MSRMFRPENAQKRAKEFLDVNKPARALEVLYEVIRRGRMRNNSEPVLEPIMFMYLNLCVEQKKSHLAKEGLYQYRNIFQAASPSTLETVVRYYLQLAEERTEQARKESHDAVSAVVVDDLDNLTTPEQMLLKAVSGEDAQDRSDRTILTPWVKFLWESYRQCLELLRNNSRVERLYHEIAKKAFDFCERYQRKTEFRKLCDNLLNHLQHLQKPPTSATAPSLSNPETQQMNLETRLEQLNYAIKMELWQEAYRAIEYVSDLMTKSKKSPKPQIMASYYQKLALVFWKAGNYLFHAAALLKLFQLNKEQKKNITPEEVSKRAAVVLVATLAIPLPSAHPEFDRFIETEKSAVEKVSRLAMLLNLPKAPTRKNLFNELIRCGVTNAVPAELKRIYSLMELEFEPLTLCPTMKQHLVWVSEQPELEQYIAALQVMTVTRLIKEVSQVYSTVTFDWLLEKSVFMGNFQLERILVDLVRHNDLQIRVDHREGCVHFGSALSESQREDLPEGPTLQPMSSESVRCQLVHMYNALNKTMQCINPDSRKKEMEEIREQCIQDYNQTKNRDHTLILQRQYTIEMRKVRLENQTIEREENIRKAQEEQQQKQRSEEQERLKREATEREKQRQEEQMKQIQTKQIKDKLEQIKQTSYGQKMIERLNEEELASLGAEEILQKQVEELEKERKELMQRLKSQEKRIDYSERAKRLVEIPKYKEIYEKQKEQDKEFWKLEEDKRVKKTVEEHQKSLEMRKRFDHMAGDLVVFLDELKANRRSETEKKLADFNARLNVERKKRLQERREQRKRDRRDAYIREKREEEQRRLDEELKKEREAKEAEELERQRVEEEEYTRKQDELDRQDRMRREKEAEIERKMQEESTKSTNPQIWRGGPRGEGRAPKEIPTRDEDSDKPGVWKAGGNSWRDKETEKLSVWKKKEEPMNGDENEPPRRDRAGMNKDIRLDEDFKHEQQQKELGKVVGGPDEDKVNWREGTSDSTANSTKKDLGDNKYSKREDKFIRRDDDSSYAQKRSDDNGYDNKREDYSNYGNRSGQGDKYQSRGGGDRGDFQRGGGDRGDFQRGGGDRGDFQRGGGDRGDFQRGGGDRGDFQRGGGDRGDFQRGGGDRGDFQRGGGDRGDFQRGGGDRGDFQRGGGDRGDFQRGGGDRGDFQRGGGDLRERRTGGNDQWRQEGKDGGGRDNERRPHREETGGNWRQGPAPEPRSQPTRNDDNRRGGHGGVSRGDGDLRRRDDPPARSGGPRGGGGQQDAPPPSQQKREKQQQQSADGDGWQKVRK